MATFRRTFLPACFLFFVLSAFSQEGEARNEAEFTAALDNHILGKVKFCQVEKDLGLAAVKSTCRKDEIDYTQNDIDLDINLQHELTWAKVLESKGIVYWTFDSKWGVTIVGICALEDGTIARFRGDIIPLRKD